MRRIYIDKKDCFKKDNSISITGDTHHYLHNVLRIKPNMFFIGFDGTGDEFEIQILSCEKRNVSGIIKKLIATQNRETPFEVTLFQSIPKGSKMDFIIKEASQLGLKKIVPIISQRVVGFDSKEIPVKKIERWKKIAIASSSVSQRRFVTDIDTPTFFKDALTKDMDISILFWEDSKVLLREVLNESVKKTFFSVGIFVGPEGGFSVEETDMALRTGVKIASLGKRILRVETASIVATAITVYELENNISC
ncbi:16S rRNA (uracil(1498)-N(3))-methyltransferase [bacterium]|nr:16S rRNA (uracil(1498)-N(3))-methyltransferase [bacterium]